MSAAQFFCSGLGWRLRGLHGSDVGHSECLPDRDPGPAGGSRFGDELGTAGGHSVHARLEGGEGHERVNIGHILTVTGVAFVPHVCNSSYMHTTSPAQTLLGHDIELSVANGIITARIFRVVDIEAEDGCVETANVFDREVEVITDAFNLGNRGSLDGRSFSSLFGSTIPAWLATATGVQGVAA